MKTSIVIWRILKDSIRMYFAPVVGTFKVLRVAYKSLEQIGSAGIAVKMNGYEPDDGQLSERQIAALTKDVQAHLPRGKLLERKSLFDVDSSKPGS